MSVMSTVTGVGLEVLLSWDGHTGIAVLFKLTESHLTRQVSVLKVQVRPMFSAFLHACLRIACIHIPVGIA